MLLCSSMENEEEGCSGNHIGMDWNFGGNGRRRHLTLIAFAASLGLLDTLKDFHTLKFQMKSQKSQGNYNLLVTGLKLSIIWAYLYNKKQHEIKNCIESSITFADFAFRQVEIDDNIIAEIIFYFVFSYFCCSYGEAVWRENRGNYSLITLFIFRMDFFVALYERLGKEKKHRTPKSH